ncbi:unnamed protein product [Cuscuta europaea]|uniref:Uncharacterized protein n=1 Tax=Cuscuta europaea TaxID=41803 RepID=A0A9P1ECR8_CUSEU|nr:unnamed protein product [Cuscuta europaea]
MGSVNEIKITATRRTEKMDAWEPRMATFPLNPTQTPTTLFLCPPLPLIWPPRHSCLCRRLLQLCLTCLVYWLCSPDIRCLVCKGSFYCLEFSQASRVRSFLMYGNYALHVYIPETPYQPITEYWST